jgi:integrase
MAGRIKTKYPGVYYYEAQRRGRPGVERIYYIVFKKDGRVYEEPAGRQYEDKMTLARAARIRSERIEGLRAAPREIRAERQAQKRKTTWTVEKLFEEYKRQRPDLKSFGPDENRFEKHIKPAFGKKRPEEIDPLSVERFKAKLQKHLSPQSVFLILALLRRICNFGHKRRLSAALSFQIDMPKVDNIKTEDLSAAELKRLFEAIDKEPHLQAGKMMKLALYTGMRRGEMFKLRWKDIDFERSFIHLRDPKGGRSQKIPLNAEARALFESIHRGRSPFVFPGRGGRQRTAINRQVARIKKAAKLPEDFRPLHGLRHVYASMLASSGQVDMYTLQKLLTHKDPKMTQRYAHLRDEALRKASDRAGALVAEAVKAKGKGKGKVVNLEPRSKQK